jgi:hypothetical protein
MLACTGSVYGAAPASDFRLYGIMVCKTFGIGWGQYLAGGGACFDELTGLANTGSFACVDRKFKRTFSPGAPPVAP